MVLISSMCWLSTIRNNILIDILSTFFNTTFLRLDKFVHNILVVCTYKLNTNCNLYYMKIRLINIIFSGSIRVATKLPSPMKQSSITRRKIVFTKEWSFTPLTLNLHWLFLYVSLIWLLVLKQIIIIKTLPYATNFIHI